ncbi:hypothetical protein KIPB_000148 [Kipferlia bialata]|uniref:Uncharacterized protein n=1 Tax=Kipferlia bialata TaxID=797122 RepID=A0A391NTY4_9EUKA|nr:hypothetical protein KIPB_000148 [Kipferlia bialata]|eukprot:g148.t1
MDIDFFGEQKRREEERKAQEGKGKREEKEPGKCDPLSPANKKLLKTERGHLNDMKAWLTGFLGLLGLGLFLCVLNYFRGYVTPVDAFYMAMSVLLYMGGEAVVMSMWKGAVAKKEKSFRDLRTWTLPTLSSQWHLVLALHLVYIIVYYCMGETAYTQGWVYWAAVSFQCLYLLHCYDTLKCIEECHDECEEAIEGGIIASYIHHLV